MKSALIELQQYKANILMILCVKKELQRENELVLIRKCINITWYLTFLCFSNDHVANK